MDLCNGSVDVPDELTVEPTESLSFPVAFGVQELCVWPMRLATRSENRIAIAAP
jgi:hypothetical protein